MFVYLFLMLAHLFLMLDEEEVGLQQLNCSVKFSLFVCLLFMFFFCFLLVFLMLYQEEVGLQQLNCNVKFS